MQRIAQLQQPLHLGIDCDPFATGGGIDPADQAILAKAGILRFEALHPIDRGALKFVRLSIAGRRGKLNATLRAQRGE